MLAISWIAAARHLLLSLGEVRFSRLVSTGGCMKSATLIGIVLIALGLAALAYQGFSYRTEEKVLDLGPIEATKETTHNVPLPPVVGALALVGGVALIAAGARGGRRMP